MLQFDGLNSFKHVLSSSLPNNNPIIITNKQINEEEHQKFSSGARESTINPIFQGHINMFEE